MELCNIVLHFQFHLAPTPYSQSLIPSIVHAFIFNVIAPSKQRHNRWSGRALRNNTMNMTKPIGDYFCFV